MIMNIFSKYMSCLLALITCACVTASVEGAQPAQKSPLRDARTRLKQVGQKLERHKKDPKANKLIKDVVQQAKKVEEAGQDANPETVKNALAPVTKMMGHLKQRKLHGPGEESTSTSTELSELESELRSCCREIKALLEEILEIERAETVCGTPIPISSVPFTITTSGKYCVTKDLTFAGAGAAITVLASNVTINFNDHSLTLTGGGTGILVQNANEFVLLNDVIQAVPRSTAITSIGVHLSNVAKATITNIFTLNTYRGIQIDTGSEDVLIENSLLKGHSSAGVLIDGASQDITIQHSALDGLNLGVGQIGIWYRSSSENMIVQESTLTGWDRSIFADQATNLKIDEVLAIGASDATFTSIVQLGDGLGAANDTVIINSIFSNPTPNTSSGAAGLFFLSGDGVVMENVIVDTHNSNNGEGILIGQQNTGFSNVQATNVIVKGTNATGLAVINGTNITFDDSQFTTATNNNILILFPSNSVVVKNSLIAHGGVLGASPAGILIQFAGGNQILDNEITLNGGDGILLSGLQSPSPQSTLNTISGNIVTANTLHGIEDRGLRNTIVNNVISGHLGNSLTSGILLDAISTNAEVSNNTVDNNSFGINVSPGATITGILDNTSCLNGVDCFGVPWAQAPGTIPVVGSNICCDGIFTCSTTALCTSP